MSITIMNLSTISNQASQKLPWVAEVFSPVCWQASFCRPWADTCGEAAKKTSGTQGSF